MNTKVVNHLAELLGRRKLKISEVARATGISRSTLTSMYYGKSSAVSFDVLDKLCKHLNCTIGELLNLSDEDADQGSAT